MDSRSQPYEAGKSFDGDDIKNENENERNNKPNTAARPAQLKYPFKKPISSQTSPHQRRAAASSAKQAHRRHARVENHGAGPSIVPPRITLKLSRSHQDSVTSTLNQVQSRGTFMSTGANTGVGSSNPAMTSTGQARSSSPVPPTVEPLSPVLGPTHVNNNSTPSQQPVHTYTHVTQTPQTFIPQPPVQPIDFMDNPDAIALRATIAALLLQKKKAEENMKKLSQLNDRLIAEPEEFIKALGNGEIKVEKPFGTRLFDPNAESDSDSGDEDEDQEEDGTNGGGMSKAKTKTKKTDSKKPWPVIPAHQNVVQVPSINWAKYGIMGESLDKLHEDQVKNPSEGRPAIIKPDGTIVPQEGGPRGNGGPIAKPVGLGQGVGKVKRGGIIKK